MSLKSTKIALGWIKLGMHILCLSLRISSFFLRISKKEIHDTVFSTRPVVLSSLNQSKLLGQLYSIASGLLFVLLAGLQPLPETGSSLRNSADECS